MFVLVGCHHEVVEPEEQLDVTQDDVQAIIEEVLGEELLPSTGYVAS